MIRRYNVILIRRPQAANKTPTFRGRLKNGVSCEVNEVKILEQQVLAKEVLDMINRRLEMVTMQYHHAQSSDRKVTAEAMAETKWQIAELKMQFVDLLTERLESN